MANPNPMKIDPYGKTSEDIISGRNVDCIHYSGCLDQAFKKKWKSFSCTKCVVNEKEDLFSEAVGRSHQDHEADNIYLQF